jgi:hypothetical protein
MDTSTKLVTRLPLVELPRENGSKTTSRLRLLSQEEIEIILGAGTVQFVVADVGKIPTWIPLTGCYDFWKKELKPHLAPPENQANLDDFPNSYCYFASEWENPDGPPIVVCEKSH